jgi:hypothetical protein
MAIVVGVAVTWLYLRRGGVEFFAGIFAPPVEQKKQRILDYTILACAAALVILLIVLPTAAWPYSPISETLHWDAGLYHFPKALEMVKTGSAWDLSIPYGEYPFGYESLIAFAGLLTRNSSLFGACGLSCGGSAACQQASPYS